MPSGRSISPPDQLRAAKVMSDHFARELPMLLLYYRVRYVGARQGVQALLRLHRHPASPGRRASSTSSTGMSSRTG